MFKFFKYYFDFSHDDEGYQITKAIGLVKVSKKERFIWLIISYALLCLSFLIFILPLTFYKNLFIWICIISLPIGLIIEFDFRIIKLVSLYLYSKSKNINKVIIYRGYMSNKCYEDLVLKVFNNYKKK